MDWEGQAACCDSESLGPVNESLRQPSATNRIRRRLKMIARCEVAGHSPVRKMLTVCTINATNDEKSFLNRVQKRLHNLTVRWWIAEWRGMAAKNRGLAADWRGSAVVILSVRCCLAASQRLNFCLSLAII